MDTPAFLIIDMVKDNFDESKRLPITEYAKRIIAPINKVIFHFRKKGWPIVFSTDAFKEDDFIFQGKMKPHSIAGTEGAKVIEELDMKPEDLWLPKPRFSAFFNTDLHKWLKERGVNMCVIAGITTTFCVLATAMDSICYDFKTVILEDCCTAAREWMHKNIIECYRKTPLYPLFRICTSSELLKEFGLIV